MSSRLNVVVVIVAVFACLLYTSPANAQDTTCSVGGSCSGCTGNKVEHLTLGSGRKIPVCCPTCSSQYFRHGIRSDGKPFCDCDFVRISGNASKGEECDNMKTQSTFNGMPICCPASMVLRYMGDRKRNHEFNCVTDGCWRGSQCASCNPSFVGSINGVSVCCPNCEESGLRIGPGTQCSCNRQ